MSTENNRILLLMLSDLSREPRVYRQLRVLHDAHYDITTAGYAPSHELVIDHWKIDSTFFAEATRDVKLSDFSSLPPLAAKAARRAKVYFNRAISKSEKVRKALLLKIKKFDYYYWSQPIVRSVLDTWEKKGCPAFDLIIVHDQDLLPVSLKMAAGRPVLLDAHEYYPGQMATLNFNLFLKNYRCWLCNEYMAQAASMITVSQGVADEYKRVYDVEPKLVFNAPFYQDLQPQAVAPQKIRLVHHGIPSPERGLETMIEMFETLDDRFVLDFFLMRNQSLDYLNTLISLASKFGDRIRFLDPVPMTELPKTLNDYDIGMCLIQPRNFNYANCLPNKFFEFVQARLAVATGPTPDMKRYCEQYQFGIVTNDFSSKTMAAQLNKLTPDAIMALKQKAHDAAPDLCAEYGHQVFLSEVKRVLTLPVVR